MIECKGSQFEREIILWAVRWYVAYPISYRQLEEMRGERQQFPVERKSPTNGGGSAGGVALC
jgi:transposase-like protein